MPASSTATIRPWRPRSWTQSCPRAPNAIGSGPDSCRSSGSRARRRRAARRPSRHGVGSCTASRRPDQPLSSSRTSIGRTKPCRRSWQISRRISTPFLCSWSARLDRSCWPATQGRWPSPRACGSTFHRCPMRRPVRSSRTSSACSSRRRSATRSSSERREIRCSPRSTFDCSTTVACSTSPTAPCASGQAQRCPFPTRSARCSRLVSIRCRAPGRPFSPTPRWSATCSGRGRSRR